MPNKNVEGDYRYKYQGQEKDPETGKEAFELRLWDSRIGRWLTTDPMGEFHSPYLGMGNNPVSKIDPTGGSTSEENPIYGSDGKFRGVDEHGLAGEIIVYDGEFTVGMSQSKILDNGGQFLSDYGLTNPGFLYNLQTLGVVNLGTIQSKNKSSLFGFAELTLAGVENFGGTSNIKLYGAAFTGDMYKTITVNINWVNNAKFLGNAYTYGGLALDGFKAVTNEGQKSEDAASSFFVNGTVTALSVRVPQIGVIYTVGSIISNTDTWQQAVHDAKLNAQLAKPFGSLGGYKPAEFRQGN